MKTKQLKSLSVKAVLNLNAVRGGEGGKGNNNNPPYGGGQTMPKELL